MVPGRDAARPKLSGTDLVDRADVALQPVGHRVEHVLGLGRVLVAVSPTELPVSGKVDKAVPLACVRFVGCPVKGAGFLRRAAISATLSPQGRLLTKTAKS